MTMFGVRTKANGETPHTRQLANWHPYWLLGTMLVLLSCLVLSLWLIGTVRAEPETVISRAWVQSPDPAE